MTQPETTAQTTSPDSAGLTVRVESFVGPLDLLLHLCRTNEMDLSRLSLRTITDQYLAHLESVRFQDLEMAGAFMVMAATLIYLKSKLLLPANPDDQEEPLDEEGLLLKRELEERLREYARVKALGVWLAEREAEQTLVYGRTTAELPPPEDIPLKDLSVHLLQRAMQRLIEDQKRRVPRQVEPNPLSVLERMSEILDLLRSTWSLLFSSVAGAERLRAEWVVTLLALLELVRLGQARARQAELFGEIVIERNAVSVHEPVRTLEAGEEAPGPVGDEEAPRAGDGSGDRMPADEAPRAAVPAPPDGEERTEQGESPNA
jgi:segregation and condensation protein A